MDVILLKIKTMIVTNIEKILFLRHNIPAIAGRKNKKVEIYMINISNKKKYRNFL